MGNVSPLTCVQKFKFKQPNVQLFLPWVIASVLPPIDAYDTAKMLCEKYYMAAPDLKIEEFNSKKSIVINCFSLSFYVYKM